MNDYIIIDHKGNKFKTKKECASFYDINAKTLTERLKRYNTLEEVFAPLENKGFKDHLENVYPSQKACAQAYGLTDTALTKRLKKMSLEEALTKGSRSITDHNGKTYPSLLQCARAYGMESYIIHHRMNNGMTLEEALTTPIKNIKDKTTDHNGKEFESLKSCAESYGLSSETLANRLESGWDVKTALLTPPGQLPKGKPFTDHLGNMHQNVRICTELWGVTLSSFRHRRNAGWTLRESLVTPNTYTNNQINDNSLNPLIMIHEYSHTVILTGDRVFRVTIISTGETKYMNEEQIKSYQ